MALLSFDASSVEPADNDFTPLPVGDYKVVISASEIKETNSNPGNKYLKFTFDVIDGKYKGRKIFENLNLWRANNTDKDKTTIRIANQKLSGLCRAVGNMKITDSAQLHNKPLLVTLKITPASGDYGEGNAITAYKSINGGNTLPSNDAPAQNENTGDFPW